MANEEHVAQLRKEAVSWNAWRKENPDNIHPDLMGANLSEADLSEADLSWANLNGANLNGANLNRAFFNGAYLNGANLNGANLNGADLSGANLNGAYLNGAYLNGAYLNGANLLEANLIGATPTVAYLVGVNLVGANLSDADLSGADLQGAILVGTNFTNANLTGCRIYGVSTWDLKLEGTKQQNLIITRRDEPEITVDNIEVAQFIYLMLDNQKVREVIDSITSKAVLILGRFTEERKPVLEALRQELRQRKYLPILFDFAVPARRNVTETIKTLAGLARLVIADVTDATEVRVELHNIVPAFPSLPIQPILLRGRPEFVTHLHLQDFPWFLPTFEYDDLGHLLANLDIVADAEAKVKAVEEALKEARRKIEAQLIKPR
jgi:uncharacterized protein YjbI with pentapeptide repeats